MTATLDSTCSSTGARAFKLEGPNLKVGAKVFYWF